MSRFQGLDWGVDAGVHAGGARFVGFLICKMGPRAELPRETAERLWREWLRLEAQSLARRTGYVLRPPEAVRHIRPP